MLDQRLSRISLSFVWLDQEKEVKSDKENSETGQNEGIGSKQGYCGQ